MGSKAGIQAEYLFIKLFTFDLRSRQVFQFSTLIVLFSNFVDSTV